MFFVCIERWDNTYTFTHASVLAYSTVFQVERVVVTTKEVFPGRVVTYYIRKLLSPFGGSANVFNNPSLKIWIILCRHTTKKRDISALSIQCFRIIIILILAAFCKLQQSSRVQLLLLDYYLSELAIGRL